MFIYYLHNFRFVVDFITLYLSIKVQGDFANLVEREPLAAQGIRCFSRAGRQRFRRPFRVNIR